MHTATFWKRWRTSGALNVCYEIPWTFQGMSTCLETPLRHCWILPSLLRASLICDARVRHIRILIRWSTRASTTANEYHRAHIRCKKACETQMNLKKHRSVDFAKRRLDLGKTRADLRIIHFAHFSVISRSPSYFKRQTAAYLTMDKNSSILWQ